MISRRQEDSVGAAGRTAFLVLGAHRSGTSLVTRLLNMLGLSLGRDLLGPHDCNVTGLWENAAIVALNEEILAAAGSAWFDHGILETDWSGADGDRVVERIAGVIREQFDGASHIAIKDPRICRLVPLYESALRRLGYGVRALIQYRSPLEVSRSLYRRDGLPETVGLGLWIAHGLQAFRDTGGWSRLRVAYEDLLVRPEGQTGQIAAWLADAGVVVDPEAQARTAAQIDPALRTSGESGTDAFAAFPDHVALAREIDEWLRRGADRDLDAGIAGMAGRYRDLYGSTGWLKEPTVIVLHGATGDDCATIEDMLHGAAAPGFGTLVVRDGEEGQSDADLVAMASRGDTGLFYNRVVRGESASLVRGLSLAAGRDVLLVRRRGWREIDRLLRYLQARDAKNDEALVFLARALEAGACPRAEDVAACSAVFVPGDLAGRLDPWSSVLHEGDALTHLLCYGVKSNFVSCSWT